jgi:hypothetical protein
VTPELSGVPTSLAGLRFRFSSRLSGGSSRLALQRIGSLATPLPAVARELLTRRQRRRIAPTST